MGYNPTKEEIQEMVDEVCQPGQSGLRPGHLHKLQNIQQFLSSRQTYHVEWIKFIEFFAQHYQAFLWSLLNLYLTLRILYSEKYFLGDQRLENVSSYMENVCRLTLMEVGV